MNTNTEAKPRIPTLQLASEAGALKSLDFTDRESYLAWVKSWKATYKKLSAFVRDLRSMHRRLQSLTATKQTENNPEYTSLHHAFNAVIGRNEALPLSMSTIDSQYHDHRHSLKSTAKAMLEARKAGKVEAGRLRAERIEQEKHDHVEGNVEEHAA